MSSVLIFLISIFPSLTISAKILLADVHSIRLTEGHWTKGRRSAPVPQLLCLENHGRDSASCNYNVQPRSAKCVNSNVRSKFGYLDDLPAQWTCEAEFPDGYTFDTVDVTCEGYEFADDKYILDGSCGLEYTVKHRPPSRNYFKSYSSDEKSSVWRSFILLLIIALLTGAAYLFWKSRQPNHPHPQSNVYGGGDPRPYPSSDGWNNSDNRRGDNDPQSSRWGSSSGNDRSTSFLSGFSLGGIAGYLFGSRRSRSTFHPFRPSSWMMREWSRAWTPTSHTYSSSRPRYNTPPSYRPSPTTSRTYSGPSSIGTASSTGTKRR